MLTNVINVFNVNLSIFGVLSNQNLSKKY